MKRLTLITVAVLFLGCGPTIYKAEDLNRRIAQHKIVAIAPIEVSIRLRSNKRKQFTAEQLKELAEKTGKQIQEKMLAWLLSKDRTKHYTVGFQDLANTDSLLLQKGISYEAALNMPKQELAKQLGVDAVICAKVFMQQPLSEGVAMVDFVLGGGFVAKTNQINTNIYIYDAQAGDLLWEYEYKVDGNLGSTPAKLTDILLRNVANRFPYRNK